MTRIRPQVSIRTRIILMVIGTLVMGQILSAYLIHNLINRQFLTQKLALVDVLTTSIMHDITYTGTDDLGATGQKVIAKYMSYYQVIRQMSVYGADSIAVASSNASIVGDRGHDVRVLDALARARPSQTVTRPNLANYGIHSVAPILRGSRIVGAVCLDVSIQDLKATLVALDRHIAAIMVLKLVVVVIALYILLRASILTRLRRLMDMTRQLTLGNYDSHVEDARGDEIGELTRAFNQMTADLRRSHEEIARQNRELEQRVQRATADLQKAYEDLKSAQGQLVLTEKMASLGVLIAGVAHEINTPVGAILNVSRTLEEHLAALPEHLRAIHGAESVPIEPMIGFVRELGASAMRSRASVGLREQRQVATLLRERGIPDWQRRATILCRYGFVEAAAIERNLESIRHPAVFAMAESYAGVAQAGTISQTSSQKISEIVRALRYYARADQSHSEPVRINESITTALVLLRNQLKQSAEVELDLDPGLPDAACSSEIHQVWTNLVSNACDAIASHRPERRGTIRIRSRRDDDRVVVSVADDGTGIPAEHLDRIFDPFFTTKDVGKGTGLGLSIVSGIIARNAGEIRVESDPRGTTFHISLPVHRAAVPEPAATAERAA